MQIQGKALYNLLRKSWQENPGMAIESWKVEDYRLLSKQELWQRLKGLKVALDEKQFVDYAGSCDSPEQLTECLCLEDDDIEAEDRLYLVVFELWRRLLPKKTSLSIFCDELDFCIDQYLSGNTNIDETLQDLLHQLEDILDENADETQHPKDVFRSLTRYCAHDLEGFLYDYISTKIDNDHEEQASELLDGFYEYFADTKWLDFLKARLFFLADESQAAVFLRGVIETLQESPDIDLLLEIADFLISKQEDELFFQTLKTASDHLTMEDDFCDLTAILADYYKHSAREKEAKNLEDLIEHRKSRNSSIIDKSDSDLKKIKKLLEETALLP